MPSAQRRLAQDLARIVTFVATPPPGGPEVEAIEHVDVPHFVAGLIEGLLRATAHPATQSAAEMRHYAHLVESVRRSVDEFQDQQSAQKGAQQSSGADPASPHRDYLRDKYPEFVGSKPITAATKRALVADMLLMGIDRVVEALPAITASPAKAPVAKRKAARVKTKAKAKPAKLAKPAAAKRVKAKAPSKKSAKRAGRRSRA